MPDMYSHFWSNILEDIRPFVGQLIPCFELLVMSFLGSKARVGSLICTWQRYMCYTFPEIHVWWTTCLPLGGQYGNWAILFHIPTSRQWWGSKSGSIVLQAKCFTNCWIMYSYCLIQEKVEMCVVLQNIFSMIISRSTSEQINKKSKIWHTFSVWSLTFFPELW